MADLKISELTLAGSLTGAELLTLVQSGGNKRALLSTVSTYAREIPQTAAELAAGVTPTDRSRMPGDFVRYGLSTSASGTVNSAAINAAFLSNSYCFCTDPGTYVCADVLLVQSNQTVFLAQGVILQASVKVWSGPLVHITSVSNVVWEGGVLDGNKAENPAGVIFGMLIRDGSNVRVVNTIARNFPSDNTTLGAAGDGFYIGGNNGVGSTNVELYSCSGLDNVRQGLSIVRCDGVAVIGGSYSGTTGDNPGGGIDIEANPALGDARNIRIVGVEMADNQSSLIMTEATFNVSVAGCQLLRSREFSLLMSDATNATIVGNYIEPAQTIDAPIIDFATCTGCTISHNVIQGQGEDSDHEGAAFRFALGSSDISITHNIIKNSRLQALALGNSALGDEPTNINFSDNTMIDCVDPAVAATAGVISVSGNTVSGDFPLFATIERNTIRDTRGTPAAFGVKLTSVPAATSAGYRIGANRIIGPTAAFDDNVTGVPPLCGVVTWNPGNLVAGAAETSPDISVAGAAIGDEVEVFPPYAVEDCIYKGSVKSTGICVIRLTNTTGAADFNGASGSWRVRVRKLFQA